MMAPVGLVHQISHVEMFFEFYFKQLLGKQIDTKLEFWTKLTHQASHKFVAPKSLERTTS